MNMVLYDYWCVLPQSGLLKALATLMELLHKGLAGNSSQYTNVTMILYTGVIF